MSQDRPAPCEIRGARLEVIEDPPGQWCFQLINGHEEMVMRTRPFASAEDAAARARTVRLIAPLARLCLPEVLR